MKKCTHETCGCKNGHITEVPTNPNLADEKRAFIDFIREHPELARSAFQMMNEAKESNPPKPNFPAYHMSNSDCFEDDDECLIAPMVTSVLYEDYINAIISQILNTSTLCGQPVLVAGNKMTGITAITNEIYLDVIQRMINDPFFETIGYCDGTRSTLLKLNGRQIGTVII